MDNRNQHSRAAAVARRTPSPAPWRKVSLLAGAALIFSLAFTGCSNNPNPQPLHTKRSDGAPWVPTYRVLPEDPRSLDPQYSYDVLGHAVIAQVYESLLQYNLFKTSPYELEPCLVEEMPKRTRHADGTETYEIRLKKGIFFHDDACFPEGKGRELKASDIFYSFQRIADPKVECPVLSSLQEFVVGLEEAYNAARESGTFDYKKPSGAITVIDDYTFQLHLKKAYPQILYWLAMPFTAPVPHEAVSYYNGKNGRALFKFHPVGTGPYVLKDENWQRGRMMRLVRHPGYSATRFPESGWPATENAFFAPKAGKPLPLLDEVQFNIIREAPPAWLLFRQGYIDRTGVGKDVFNSAITAGLTLSPRFAERGVTLQKDIDPGTFYLQFNMEDPVVGTNVNLRRALSMAYNQELSNEIFSNGVDIKAEQLLPPGVIGYDPNFKNKYREFNLPAAKKLLAEAGYPNGIDPKTGRPLVLTLDIAAASSAGRQRAEFDKTQLEQLGIQIKIEENTWAGFQDKVHRGAFQMNNGSGWHADFPDPENFFFLFYSKNIPPQGNNSSRFKNAEFDALFEKMATMDNGPERLAIIQKMTKILTDEAVVIFGSHGVNFTLSQPWLPRVSSNAMLALGAGMKYIDLDPKLRAEKQIEWNKAPIWPTALLGALFVGMTAYGIVWARKSTL